MSSPRSHPIEEFIVIHNRPMYQTCYAKRAEKVFPNLLPNILSSQFSQAWWPLDSILSSFLFSFNSCQLAKFFGMIYPESSLYLPIHHSSRNTRVISTSESKQPRSNRGREFQIHVQSSNRRNPNRVSNLSPQWMTHRQTIVSSTPQIKFSPTQLGYCQSVVFR